MGQYSIPFLTQFTDSGAVTRERMSIRIVGKHVQESNRKQRAKTRYGAT